MKFIRNESGITLIELLAALVIGSVIVGLTGMILVQTFTQADVTTDHASLRQEANIALSQLRSDYTQMANMHLDFDEEARMLLSGSSEEDLTPLADEGFSFDAFHLYQQAPDNDIIYRFEYTEGELNQDEPVAFASSSANRLYVNFVLSNEAGRTFEVDTMISRLGDYEDYLVEEEDPETDEELESLAIAANHVMMNEEASITANEGNVYIRESFEAAPFDHRYLTGDVLYFDTDVIMDRFCLGEAGNQVYVTGGLTITGDDPCSPRIGGNLFYSGDPDVIDEAISGPVPEDFETVWPTEFDYRRPVWYLENGWGTDLDDDPRYYDSRSINVIGGPYDNVQLVSRQNVTLSTEASVTSGLIFAPDGMVTLEEGASFSGTIIADRIAMHNHATVTFDPGHLESMLNSPETVPFLFDRLSD